MGRTLPIRVARLTTGDAVGAGFLAAAVLTAGGCATVTALNPTAPMPSASVTTTAPGAEAHWFKLEWAVEPGRAGARRISGYVYNNYGSPVEQMRLLAQALDTSDGVVGQRIAWVPGGLPATSRGYFQIDGLPDADHYRVTVWSFDFSNVKF
jgi:hypothetical protein